MKNFFLLVVVSLCCLLPDKTTFAADNITAIFPAIPAENYANSLILSTDSNEAIVDGQLKTGANVKMRNGMVWLPLRLLPHLTKTTALFGCLCAQLPKH